jgi:hypothetical protein
VKTRTHIASEVDDLESRLGGDEILVEPNSPSPGVRVMVVVGEARVENLRFTR